MGSMVGHALNEKDLACSKDQASLCLLMGMDISEAPRYLVGKAKPSGTRCAVRGKAMPESEEVWNS